MAYGDGAFRLSALVALAVAAAAPTGQLSSWSCDVADVTLAVRHLTVVVDDELRPVAAISDDELFPKNAAFVTRTSKLPTTVDLKASSNQIDYIYSLIGDKSSRSLAILVERAPNGVRSGSEMLAAGRCVAAETAATATIQPSYETYQSHGAIWFYQFVNSQKKPVPVDWNTNCLVITPTGPQKVNVRIALAASNPVKRRVDFYSGPVSGISTGAIIAQGEFTQGISEINVDRGHGVMKITSYAESKQANGLLTVIHRAKETSSDFSNNIVYRFVDTNKKSDFAAGACEPLHFSDEIGSQKQ